MTEQIKINSNYLRGNLADDLKNQLTGSLTSDNHQLIKFHGIYEQDDRDRRQIRAEKKLEKDYSFMIRLRIAGGKISAKQWLGAVEVANLNSTGVIKITTRQTIQLHGIIKSKLKPTVQFFDKFGLDSIAACGDVNRNVMSTAVDAGNILQEELRQLAVKISDEFLPKTNAFKEVWLDGEPIHNQDEGNGDPRNAGRQESAVKLANDSLRNEENLEDLTPPRTADAVQPSLKGRVIAPSLIDEIEPVYGKTYLPRKFKIALALPPFNDVDVFAHDIGLIAITKKDILLDEGIGDPHEVGRQESAVKLVKTAGLNERINLLDEGSGDPRNAGRSESSVKLANDSLQNKTDLDPHEVGRQESAVKLAKSKALSEILGFNISIGGGMGATHGNEKTYPRLGNVIGYASKDKILQVVEKIITTQRDFGNREDRKQARLKYTIDRLGLDWFKNELENRLGFKLQKAQPFEFKQRGDLCGWKQDLQGRHHFTLFVENGLVLGGIKDALSQIAKEDLADLNFTNNQNVILSNITNKKAVEEIIKKYQLQNNQSKTRQNSMACVALNTCPLALAEGQRYLPTLLTKIEDLLLKHNLQNEEISIRMTGCPNGCARPYLAEIGLVGKSLGHYNFYLGGSEIGSRLNLLHKENLNEEAILSELNYWFAIYSKERLPHESFGDFSFKKITNIKKL